MIPPNLPPDLMALDLSRNSLDLKQLRQYLCHFKSLQSLSLSFAEITSLSDILRECSSVLELNLTGNRLRQVDSKTFKGLENLRRLLGLEVESVVSRDVFRGLKNLKDLDLIYHGGTLPEGLFDNMVIQGLNLVLTKATSLPAGIFQFGRKTLNTLQLVGENVSALSEDLLDDLCVLSRLFLVMPSVTKLPERFFHSQKQSQQNMTLVCPANLQEVEITGIQTLPAKLFNQLANLETLQLQKIGSFPQIGFLAEVVNLRMLVITGSSLTSIPASWFKELYSLETLKLSGVQLENLHDDAFKGLISLNHLDLSNNNLQEIRGTVLKPLSQTLETLILSGNSLTEISGDCLSGLHSLRFLDISENRLRNIYADSFVGMTFLSVLYLNKNRLTSLPADIFRDQRQLESLSVADNYLIEFPKAILKLKMSLVNLDLSSNELREVPASELCQFVYLEVVGLMDNSLHCDCCLLAFQHCPETSVEGLCKTPEKYSDMYLNDIEVPKSCDVEKQLASAPTVESNDHPTLLKSTSPEPERQQTYREERLDSSSAQTNSTMPGSLASNQDSQPKVSPRPSLLKSALVELKSLQKQGEEKSDSKATQTESGSPSPATVLKSTSAKPENQNPPTEKKSDARAVQTDSDVNSTLGEEGSRSKNTTHQPAGQPTSALEANSIASKDPGKPDDTVIRQLFTEELSTSHFGDTESTVPTGDESSSKPIQKDPLPVSNNMAVTPGVSNLSQKLDDALVKEAAPKVMSSVQDDSADMQRQKGYIDGANEVTENVLGSLNVSEATATQRGQQQPPDTINDQTGEIDKVTQEDIDMASQQKPNSSEGPSAATVLPTGQSLTATLSTETPYNKEKTGTTEPDVFQNKSGVDDSLASSAKGSVDDEKMMGDAPVQDSSDQSQQVADGILKKDPKQTAKETRSPEGVNSPNQVGVGAKESDSSSSKLSTHTQGKNRSAQAPRMGDATRSFVKAGGGLAGGKQENETVMPGAQQTDLTDLQKQGDGGAGFQQKEKEDAKEYLGVGKAEEAPQEGQQQPGAANKLGVTPQEQSGSETAEKEQNRTGTRLQTAEKEQNPTGTGKTNTSQLSTEGKADEKGKGLVEDTDSTSKQNTKKDLATSTLESSDVKLINVVSKPTEASKNQSNGTGIVEPSVLEKNESQAADTEMADAGDQDLGDQLQLGVDGILKNNPKEIANNSKLLKPHPSEDVKNQTLINVNAGQSGGGISKPPLQLQTPGNEKATLTQKKGETSVSRSFEKIAITGEDGNTPEGQEMGNSGDEDAGKTPEEADKSPEKIAFNFTISALAALLMFCCSLLAIYGIRRWQHKGSYILSYRDSEDMEMDAMDRPASEEASALQECEKNASPLPDKPFK